MNEVLWWQDLGCNTGTRLCIEALRLGRSAPLHGQHNRMHISQARLVPGIDSEIHYNYGADRLICPS